MIEMMMIHVMFQIFKFNLTGNTLPWNTNDINGNFSAFPTIVTRNLPWFFPFITMVLLLVTDYVFGVKKGVDTKVTFWGVAFIYTMVTYIEVAGSLTTSGYFYLFEFIAIASLFVMTLFTQSQQE